MYSAQKLFCACQGLERTRGWHTRGELNHISMKDEKIQVLRAIALIAVVMIHTCPYGLEQVVCRPFLNFAVPLFLFISAYLTKEQHDSWISLYKRRILRVFIPYVIWTFIYTLPSSGIFPYAYNLITTRSCYALYYIFVYIQLVLLTPLLFKLARSPYHWVGWLVTPISIFAFKYAGYIWGIELNGIISIFWSISFLGWFSFYYMGICLRVKDASRFSNAKLISVLLFISILLQCGEGYLLLNLGIGNCGSALKLTSLLTNSLFILLFWIALQKNSIKFNAQYLVIIGNYSFGIYLLHPLVLKFIRKWYFYHNIPFVFNSALVLFISLSICYLVSKVFGSKVTQCLGIK